MREENLSQPDDRRMKLQKATANSFSEGAKRRGTDGALWLYSNENPGVVYIENLKAADMSLKEWEKISDAFREVIDAEPSSYIDWEPIVMEKKMIQ
jgi:hypothetical protein